MKKIIGLLIVALLVMGIHAGFMFGAPEFQYRMFKSDAEDAINFNYRLKENVVEAYQALIKEHKIPITDEQIEEGLNDKSVAGMEVWEEDMHQYSVNIKYSVTVNYFDLHKKTFNYALLLKNF